MEKIYPRENDTGSIGTADKAWDRGYFDDISLQGVDYVWPAADGTSGQVLKTDGSATLSWTAAGGATAFDDIGDPDAAGTIAMTTYQQTLTSTKTNDDNFLIQGLGAFGDVSVLRVEQKTGDPTDGTVLEVVAADANVDPLVVSSSGLANALVVGQNAGTVACGGILTVAGAATVTGVLTGTAGLSCGAASTTTLKTDVVALTNAQIKDLYNTPVYVVAAPGSGKMLEFVSAVLVLDHGGSNDFTGANASVIRYHTSNVAASASIPAGSFTASADAMTFVLPAGVAAAAATSFVNLGLEITTATAAYAGNAGANNVMKVIITYRVHDDAL